MIFRPHDGPARRGPSPLDEAAPGDEVEGRVRWFSQAKGYGFIEPDGGGDDVFVRHSSIAGEGFRSLEEGQRVRFLRASDHRGPQAVRVRDL